MSNTPINTKLHNSFQRPCQGHSHANSNNASPLNEPLRCSGNHCQGASATRCNSGSSQFSGISAHCSTQAAMGCCCSTSNNSPNKLNVNTHRVTTGTTTKLITGANSGRPPNHHAVNGHKAKASINSKRHSE